MKKILVSIVIMLVFATSCAPGSDLEVTTPESTIELRSPGPNPQLNQTDDAGRISGFVQGLISGTLTLFLKKGLERMSAMFFRARQSDEGMGRNMAALFVPPIVTATAIATILVTAHTLAGTPEILTTIAVPFTVSTAYAILYNLKLWREGVLGDR